MIWHARVVNNYGGTNACLDRFVSLPDAGTLCFTNGHSHRAKLMLGTASPHFVRCSRTWAGRIAYVTEWRSFKAKNEREWMQVCQL
ncbi:hypothetical protein FRC07_000498, partial [Ceratobasidium sp. 392]